MYELDHIVHFVDKPENLVEETKKIGLHTALGGKHEMWGTYNSLCYFGLSYIEFIGVFDQELLEKSAEIPYTLHDSYKKRHYTNGLTRLAFRTTTIKEDAKRLEKAGFEVDGPQQFSRVRPDGSVVKWQLLHFGKKDLAVDFPFLIQWEGTNEERFNELVKLGTIGEHSLGNLSIKEITYAVRDLSVANEWARVFQSDTVENEGEIKVLSPNCTITFKKSDEDKIAEVIIAGAEIEKVVNIEGATYKFQYS
ncbi:glyoxalase-like protein [Ureibacillus xyleni]|uniref:Glyoxalase-like protein n=1 Tax=Ureibacillus xyleni TaxID=614648 RepID=A0A285TGS3_9BACL|nr:VOC family protein [Ureibacillus xyleni]SOC19542.1 glyoxalase-like protein [Ureibacillus xyleni]